MNHGQELAANNSGSGKLEDLDGQSVFGSGPRPRCGYPNLSDKNGHKHFEISLDGRTESQLEIVYNLAFGALPDSASRHGCEGCGDYITSTAPAGPYPASPDGAILHWVHGGGGDHTPHGNDAVSQIHRHDSGFLVINDKVYGL